MTKGQRAVALKDAGFQNDEIAGILDMPKSSVRRLISETRAGTGEGASGALQGSHKAQRPLPRHIIIPDTQVKPGVDTEHLRWASAYIAEKQPDVVIHLGDHWDMSSLSEYDRGKRSFEGRRYKDDIAAGREGIEILMSEIRKMPKKPRLVFTLGNHEERIHRAVEKDATLEGIIGYQDFNLEENGWEVYDFLQPVCIDSIFYAHYWANPQTGRPYTGSVENMLRAIGFSFSMGHRQGLWVGRRELNNGTVQRGLVAGSFYSHMEDYKGYQGNYHWRGILVCNEVANGDYGLTEVSLDYLKRSYG